MDEKERVSREDIETKHYDTSSLEIVSTFTAACQSSEKDIVTSRDSITIPEDFLSTRMLKTKGTAFYDLFDTLRESMVNIMNKNLTSDKEYKQLMQSLMQKCDGLKDIYTEEILHLSSDAYKLLLEIEELQQSNERLQRKLNKFHDSESRSVRILRDANDSLNQYITDTETYHTKEVAELKAKLSLIRIVKEIQTGTASGNTHDQQKQLQHCDTQCSSNENIKPTKKRRSLLFWKRSSKSLSNLGVKESEDAQKPTISILSQNSTANFESEMQRKYTEIEDLRTQCKNLQQKERILEQAVTNKNIELNRRENRVNELKVKGHKMDMKCSKNLQDVHNKLCSILNTVNSLSILSEQNRLYTKKNKGNLWLVKNTLENIDAANKQMMAKLNRKMYEIHCQRTKSNAVVGEMKKFLADMSMVLKVKSSEGTNENANKEEAVGSLQIIMSSIKTQVENFMASQSHHNKGRELCTPTVSQYCQTDDLIPAKCAIKDTSVFYDQIFSERNENSTFVNSPKAPYLPKKDPSDSDVAINVDSQHQTNKIDNNNGFECVFVDRGCAHVPGCYTYGEEKYDALRNGFLRSAHLTNEMLSYMEGFKEREINGYRKDIQRLEKQNHELRLSLNNYKERIDKKQAELNYQKFLKKRSKPPMTSTPEYVQSDTQNRHGITAHFPWSDSKKQKPQFLTEIPTYNSYREEFGEDTRQVNINTQFHDKEKQDEQNKIGEIKEDALFLHAFERGTALIDSIFRGKEKMEREIEMTNKNIRNRRSIERIRTLLV